MADSKENFNNIKTTSSNINSDFDVLSNIKNNSGKQNIDNKVKDAIKDYIQKNLKNGVLTIREGTLNVDLIKYLIKKGVIKQVVLKSGISNIVSEKEKEYLKTKLQEELITVFASLREAVRIEKTKKDKIDNYNLDTRNKNFGEDLDKSKHSDRFSKTGWADNYVFNGLNASCQIHYFTNEQREILIAQEVIKLNKYLDEYSTIRKTENKELLQNSSKLHKSLK